MPNLRMRAASSSVCSAVMRLFISASTLFGAGFGAEENHGRPGVADVAQRLVGIAQQRVDAAFGPPAQLSGVSSSACLRAWLSFRKKLLS